MRRRGRRRNEVHRRPRPEDRPVDPVQRPGPFPNVAGLPRERLANRYARSGERPAWIEATVSGRADEELTGVQSANSPQEVQLWPTTAVGGRSSYFSVVAGHP